MLDTVKLSFITFSLLLRGVEYAQPYGKEWQINILELDWYEFLGFFC